jgi:hypothetical protein
MPTAHRTCGTTGLVERKLLNKKAVSSMVSVPRNDTLDISCRVTRWPAIGPLSRLCDLFHLD